MGLFDSFLNRAAPRREPRDTTDDEVNVIFVPLRDHVCDFKDATKMSWALILPAVQKLSIRLFIRARGRESTQRLLEFMIRKMEEERGIRSSVFENFGDPEVPPEDLPKLADLNALLWAVANDAIAKGRPVEHVAQAFSGFVGLVGSRVMEGQFGEFYAAGLLHTSYKQFKAGEFDD